MSEKYCVTCENTEQKLRQHEQTIAQLMEIIAVTNRKLTELDLKQAAFEKACKNQLHPPRFTVTPDSPFVSPNMLRSNE